MSDDSHASLTVADFTLADHLGLEALQVLVNPILPQLYDFIARRTIDGQEAEDVLQQTLWLAFKTCYKSDQELGLLDWLLSIATRVLLNRVNSDPLCECGLGFLVQDDSGRTNDKVSRLYGRLLASEISHFAKTQRFILGLFVHERWSIHRISTVLGISPHKVESSISTTVLQILIDLWPEEPESRLNRNDVYLITREILLGNISGSYPRIRSLIDTLSVKHTTFSMPPNLEARLWKSCSADFPQQYVPPLAVGNDNIRVYLWAVAACIVLLFAAVLGANFFGIDSSAKPSQVKTAERLVSDQNVSNRSDDSTSNIAARINGFVRDRYLSGRLVLLHYGPDGNSVGVVDFDTGNIARDVFTDLSPNVVFAISPSGRYLAYGKQDAVMLSDIIDRSPPRWLITLQSPNTDRWRYEMDRTPHRFRVAALAWHPNEQILAVASEPIYYRGLEHSRVQLVRVRNSGGETISTIVTLQSFEDVVSLDWSADGTQLLIGTDRRILLASFSRFGFWDLKQLPGRGTATWSPDDKLVLWVSPSDSASGSSLFGVTNPSTGKSSTLGTCDYARWEDDPNYVVFLQGVSNHSDRIVLSRMNLSSGEVDQVLQVAFKGNFESNALLSPDGRYLLYNDEDGLHLYDAKFQESVWRLDYPPKEVISPLVWMSGWQSYDREFETLSGTIIYPKKSGSKVSLVSLDLRTGSTRQIAAASKLSYTVGDQALMVRTSKSNALLYTQEGIIKLYIPPKMQDITAVELTSSGSTIAYATREGRGVAIWEITPQRSRVNLARSKPIAHLRTIPLSLDFSPSGRWILIKDRNNVWHLFNNKFKRIKILPRADRYSWMVLDGKDVLVQLKNLNISIYTPRGKTVYEINGYVNAYAPLDDGYIAVWTMDDDLRVYDLRKKDFVTWGSMLGMDYSELDDSSLVQIVPISDGGSWIALRLRDSVYMLDLSNGYQYPLQIKATSAGELTWLSGDPNPQFRRYVDWDSCHEVPPDKCPA
ncbi:RNA polymerase, sigma-24 subunit, ECF subfamily [Thermobaculum terrenum ATCC BAA-798]|uniref:RNA polymerase, sigma-24 subunit, ECF subfamily n=1 Tax=Thermobaculum terrenum (strain ATCC BAA-798 / CCMEE 7001 / YNP1) TaxID=525904 RepID=D1CDN3_THET1|nr:sigma factor [Thermobaculum terrenum]ACZ41039.1 RNA polymerase, sigma-24 subunit, ECF subfamily [Thermobaculum terrenum ATCC BAA-798]